MFGFLKNKKHEESRPQEEGMYIALLYQCCNHSYLLHKNVIKFKVAYEDVGRLIVRDDSAYCRDIYGASLGTHYSTYVRGKDCFWINKDDAAVIGEMRQKGQFHYYTIYSNEKFNAKHVLKQISNFKENKFPISVMPDRDYVTDINGYRVAVFKSTGGYDGYFMNVSKDKYSITSNDWSKSAGQYIFGNRLPGIRGEAKDADSPGGIRMYEYKKLVDFYANFPVEEIKQWLKEIEEEIRMKRESGIREKSLMELLEGK